MFFRTVPKNTPKNTMKDNGHNNRISRIVSLLLVAVFILTCAFSLSSCTKVRDFFRKKAEITFVANGGTVSEKYAEEDRDKEDGEDRITLRCFVDDDLPKDVIKRKYYKLDGWFTSPEGGKKRVSCPEKKATYYAHWKSANEDRSVDITDIKAETPDTPGKVRIASDEEKNKVTVRFTLSEWFGQDVALVNKNGKVLKNIDVGKTEEDGFTDEPLEVSFRLPGRKWMDHKSTAYYIKSFGNDHVDETEPVKFKVVLDGQCRYFDLPVEGSTCWYGGPGDAPSDRTAVILATDDSYVYAKHESTNETEDGSIIYKWKKKDVMINLADVRTDIVYDIYNAYSSKFFPIKGKAMYMDNGKKGLKRYAPIKKASAMHFNSKTGKTTFMVPVQWDFAEVVAKAQERARDAGVTLYIADSFRPMKSVDPVAKKVKNASLLAYGGTSAHNFGMAVDTGWQAVNEKGEPIGKPYVKNLQALDKKKAVKGPRGNTSEIWWEGVNKLPQEWWHYGDATLKPEFKDHAKRVGSLYVNLRDCRSEKRSKL